MKQENEQNVTTTEKTDPEGNSGQKVGYPDISKANTKTVVIASLAVIIILFLLSVFFPLSSLRDGAVNGATTEQNQESTTEQTTESHSSELFDMGQFETSLPAEVFSMPTFPSAKPGFQEIHGKLYYLQKGENPFSGWLRTENDCFYIQHDGTVTLGWQQIDNRFYYFDNDGKMITNQWIDNRYVGADGAMYCNRITPDSVYVGNDGYEDHSLGTTGSQEGLRRLKRTLEELIAGYSGSWSVYVKDIANNEYLSINNTQYFSASLIKLYCAAAAYDLMEKEVLKKTDRISSLMTQMVSISDNDAFNLMVAECSGCNSQIAGRPVIQAYIDAEGYKDTTITSMLLPTKYRSPSSPGRNYTTVEDCGLLLEKIYKGKCVNPEVSRQFLNLLLNQSHVNKIPAGLPEGTKCANKTGDTDDFQHDAAIVYSPGGDYIITIMSTDCGAAIPNTQELSATVYAYFN